MAVDLVEHLLLCRRIVLYMMQSSNENGAGCRIQLTYTITPVPAIAAIMCVGCALASQCNSSAHFTFFLRVRRSRDFTELDVPGTLRLFRICVVDS